MGVSTSVSALIEQSRTLERSGDIAAAFQAARQALSFAQASREAESIAAALTCLGFIYYRNGDFDQARRLADQALSQAAPEIYAHVDAQILLGSIAIDTDDLDGGERYFRRAIDLARLQGYHRALARALHNLASGVYAPRGQFALALATDEEAVRIAAARDLPPSPFPYMTMAWIHLTTGQMESARAVCAELARLAPPGSLAEGYLHFFNGGRALYEGKLEQALTLYRQARSIAEAIGEPGLNVDARLGVSRCLRAQGNASAARDWADDAYKVTCRVKCLYAQGMALIERGRTAWESGDVQAAEADFRNAIEVTTRIQADFYLTRATFLLAGLLHRRNSAQARPVWLDAARWIISGGYAFLLEQERALAFPLVAAYLGDADSEMAGLSATLLEQLARVPPPSLRIVMLGRLEVWQGTRHIESRALRQRRAGELLAVLLTAPGHALAADQVAEALSPDKSPEAAQIVVHHATSELRRILEPELPDRRFSSRYLEATDRLISLHLPPGSWLDTEAFEQAVQARDWEQALALYGGEFLPEYRYADWAAVRRERLAEDYRTVLLALAEARLAEKDWTAALDFARRLITRDPWHEGAVMAAMRACQGLNDLSAARRYYKRLEKTLGEELDVQPQEELQTLYHSLDNRRRK